MENLLQSIGLSLEKNSYTSSIDLSKVMQNLTLDSDSRKTGILLNKTFAKEGHYETDKKIQVDSAIELY